MKIAIGICGIAILLGTRAFAADMEVKAPPLPTPPVWSWTGFYVGGNIGAKLMHDRWTATSLYDGTGPLPGFFTVLPVDASSPRNYNLLGLRAGGYVGYNWQLGPTWVGGVEGDAAWAQGSKTQPGLPGCSVSVCGAIPGGVVPSGLGGDTASVKMLWDAGVRARLGYLITPDLFLYGTSGVAFQRVEASGQCAPFANSVYCIGLGIGPPVAPGITEGHTLIGWTVGLGLEDHLWGNWLLRAEYRYANFGSWGTSFAFLAPPFVNNNTYRFGNAVNTSIATVGLAYKF